MTLRNRVVRLEVGPAGGTGRAWEDLRIKARVKHSRDSNKNTAKITVWNLSTDSIDYLSGEDRVFRLLAGYGRPTQIFAGRLKDDGLSIDDKEASRVVRLDLIDGNLELKRAHLNLSIAGPVRVRTVLEKITDQVDLVVGRFDLPKNPRIEQGLTLTGAPERALGRLARLAEADWWIQDRKITFVEATGNSGRRAAAFSSESGSLIGSPTRGKDDRIKFTGLLRPKVRPADIVRLEDDRYGGFYQARDVGFQLDTWATPFYVKITARPL